MTRHRPHPVLSSLLALALLTDTGAALHIASQSSSLATWMTAVALGYVTVLAALWALVTVWHWARTAPYRRARAALYRPTGRPQPGSGSRPAAPVSGRHARTEAVAPVRDGWTQTLPALDDTLVMAAAGGGR